VATPPDVPEERLKHLLFACRQQWELTQSPTALIEAFGWLRPRLPSWLEIAIIRALSAGRSKAQRKAQFDNERHAMRYLEVKHLKRDETTWDQAYAQAAEALAKTSAAGEPETMAASYKRVKKALDAGEIARYHFWRDLG
jgi:hypothetical protein